MQNRNTAAEFIHSKLMAALQLTTMLSHITVKTTQIFGWINCRTVSPIRPAAQQSPATALFP